MFTLNSHKIRIVTFLTVALVTAIPLQAQHMSGQHQHQKTCRKLWEKLPA